MTTHHRPRLHPHLVARTTGQSIAVATAGGVLAALGCPVWVVLLLAAAGVLELVHDAHRRQERRWAANNQPLPDSDLSRPLAEVLPPLTRAALAASAAPEETPMPSTVLDVPPMPAAYAREIDVRPHDPPSLPEIRAPRPIPVRWLYLGQMRKGDVFAYAHGDHEVELTFVGAEGSEALDELGLLSVVVEGKQALTLPADQRWRMLRAERVASVRCLLCSRPVEEHRYDLVSQPPLALAICPSCEHSSTGGAP